MRGNVEGVLDLSSVPVLQSASRSVAAVLKNARLNLQVAMCTRLLERNSSDHDAREMRALAYHKLGDHVLYERAGLLPLPKRLDCSLIICLLHLGADISVFRICGPQCHT